MKKMNKVLIKDIMTKAVKTVAPDDTVFDAVKKMNKFHIGNVVVVKANTPRGILTDRDILTRVVEAQKDPKGVKVKEVMSPKPATADANDTEVKVLFLMTQQKVKKMIITDKGKLAGIITQSDLLKYLGKKWASF